MPSRYDAQIDHIRASLADKTGAELREALASELETFSLPALAADSNGRYVAANTAAQQLTGYSCEELMQMTVIDLTPRPSASDGEELWGEFIESGVQQGTYELRRKGAGPATVRYWAYTNIVPGIHLSLLQSDRPAV